MKNFSYLRSVVGICLSLLLVLPTVGLAKSRRDSSFIPRDLIKNELNTMSKLGGLLTKYKNECEGIVTNPLTTKKQLKPCLEYAKEIQANYAGFSQASQSAISKIKSAEKWTQVL
ncbi:MAG TPA: hypothetical protein VFQ43_08735, partial [Nitrososphaera sp.]|nr:hypothetical protein [Nitrososphaera sp.]